MDIVDNLLPDSLAKLKSFLYMNIVMTCGDILACIVVRREYFME